MPPDTALSKESETDDVYDFIVGDTWNIPVYTGWHIADYSLNKNRWLNLQTPFRELINEFRLEKKQNKR